MSDKKPADPDLKSYRRKRQAGSTPEPFGGSGSRKGLFVVQKHAATHTHYDFRVELGGVLKSWAIPRGPSLNPEIKRLAMFVEDHPVEYADFEGIVPAGNYGAGPVIVWDQGVWIPIDDPVAGLRDGKLLFDLRGHKLGGRWTLVRTKKTKQQDYHGPSREWLLIKKEDAWVARNPALTPNDRSIFSGLHVEDLGRAAAIEEEVDAELQETGLAKVSLPFHTLKPMLAQKCDPGPEPAAAYDNASHLFELKYDGFRLLARRQGSDVQLRYRSGTNVTALYPEVGRALSRFALRDFIVDGEVVVLDDNGRPRFQRLQKRSRLSRTADIAQASVNLPVVFYVFDVLQLLGRDLRPHPLVARKALLNRFVPSRGPVRVVDHIDGVDDQDLGQAFFDKAAELELEGIVAKRRNGTYVHHRSTAWRKIRREQVDDFVIVGFTPTKAGRTGFGALHLAAHEFDDTPLRYAGRVGTGFSEEALTMLQGALADIRIAAPPCRDAPTSFRQHIWVEPSLVCAVRFRERSDSGNLRMPVFLRLLSDKRPDECILDPEAEPVEAPPPNEAPEAKTQSPSPNPSTGPGKVVITNRHKIFWPEQGLSKGDLVDYYAGVAPLLAPYLRDRPVVLTRYPDGIHGKSFYQKDAPEWTPAWVRTERIYSEHADREIDYFIADDEDTLLHLVNMGTIPLHVWCSRWNDIGRPDWCILDLDPKEAPFSDVVAVARHIKRLCDDIGLPAVAKTSGSTGLHVLIPLGGQCTYAQSRSLGEVLGHVVSHEIDAIATMVRAPSKRQGKVYIDWLQNRHGQLLVAPYSVRPLPGAPISMPLSWRQVNSNLKLSDYTIQTAPAILRRRRQDPCLSVLQDKPDLQRALSLLSERLSQFR